MINRLLPSVIYSMGNACWFSVTRSSSVISLAFWWSSMKNAVELHSLADLHWAFCRSSTMFLVELHYIKYLHGAKFGGGLQSSPIPSLNKMWCSHTMIPYKVREVSEMAWNLAPCLIPPAKTTIIIFRYQKYIVEDINKQLNYKSFIPNIISLFLVC